MEKQIILTTWLSESEESLKLLQKYYEKGINTYRLNCAKGEENDMTWITCSEIVRNFYKKKGSNVNIMLDIPMPGGKIRYFDTKIEYVKKDEVVYFTSDINQYHKLHKSILISTSNFAKNINVSEVIIIGESHPKFVVEDKWNDNTIMLKCIEAGRIPFRKYIVSENIKYFSCLEEKNYNYYNYLLDKIKPEMVALSFVENVDDITKIKKAIIKNRNIKIISKIESLIGAENIESIAGISDAIIIARGDLLHNVGLEKFGKSIDKIIDCCNHLDKDYYVATGIFETVVEKKQMPTRAEILDLYYILKNNASGIVLEYSKIKNIDLFENIMIQVTKLLKTTERM